MNTWGYLILIAALLLLAAAMLYARFASRSREKSLHHPPVELTFPYETISAASTGGREVSETTGPEKENQAGPEIKIDRVIPPLAGKGGVKEETKKRESDYFDELQEAAAGLAMLMRSSPVGRVEPVIFAPEPVEDEMIAEEEPVAELAIEEETEEETEKVTADLESEVATEETLLLEEPVAEPVTESVAELVEEEMVPEVEDTSVLETEPLTEEEIVLAESEESEVCLPVEVRVLTMREILGDQVGDRIDQIDEGLDALEALVRNIESSLRALDSAEWSDEDEEIAAADADGTIVSEAA